MNHGITQVSGTEAEGRSSPYYKFTHVSFALRGLPHARPSQDVTPLRILRQGRTTACYGFPGRGCSRIDSILTSNNTSRKEDVLLFLFLVHFQLEEFQAIR